MSSDFAAQGVKSLGKRGCLSADTLSFCFTESDEKDSQSHDFKKWKIAFFRYNSSQSYRTNVHTYDDSFIKNF